MSDAPSQNDLVAILSAPTPPAVAAARQEDAARRLYPTMSADLVPDTTFDGSKYSDDLRHSAASNLREMVVDLGISGLEAKQLLNRAAIVREEGKPAEVQMREARKELRRVFGDSSDAVLRDVGKLVNRDPRLGKYLNAQGLGNDPETLVMLGRAARSQRAAGKLK